MTAKWKGKIIVKYTGQGLTDPTQCDIAANKFNQGLMDRLVEQTAPYNFFTLYNGFLNYIKDHHRGLVQKGSQLNKQPWLGWILFINEEVEKIFCYSDRDLDESILVNCLI